jgi:hypothetical protein
MDTQILLKVTLNTNKTDHHSIAEIMWKVALNTNKTDHYGIVLFLHFDDTFLAHLAKGHVSFCHHLASVVPPLNRLKEKFHRKTWNIC